MDQQKCHPAQRGKKVEWLDVLAATRGQSWLRLEEKWDVRAKCGGEFVQFFRQQRLLEQFVETKQCCRCIPASAAQAGRQWNSFPEMDAHAVLDARRLQKRLCRAVDQVARI